MDTTLCQALHKIPSILTEEALKDLLRQLDQLNISAGQSDAKFVEMCEARNGKFFARNAREQVVAYLDIGRNVTVEGNTYAKTIRHSECELLVPGSQCQTCVQYGDNLRSMYRSYSLSNKVNKHTNLRYLRSPQKVQRIKALWSALRNKQRQLQRLRKLELLTYKEGLDVPEDLQQDIGEVITQHQPVIAKLPNDDFKRVFWEQQVIS